MSNNFNTPEIAIADQNKETLINNGIRDTIKALTETNSQAFATDANQTPAVATARATRKFICTGAGPAATRDLILPLEKHVYTVHNNLTSVQSIRVIGSSGTGVTIPHGETATVICDGTNFVLIGFEPPSAPGFLLNFCADSLAVNVGTSYYAWVNFITTQAATTERWISIPFAGKLSHLRVISAVAPAVGSVTFTVRTKAAAGGTGAGSDSALIATVAAGATIGTNTTTRIAVNAGDEISVKIVENAGYTGSMVRIMISVLFTF